MDGQGTFAVALLGLRNAPRGSRIAYQLLDMEREGIGNLVKSAGAYPDPTAFESHVAGNARFFIAGKADDGDFCFQH